MASTNNIHTINFFGPVEDFWGQNAADFSRQIEDLKGQDLEILINSPGGEVFEGIAISNLLARRDGRTTTTGIGLVASIATVVLLAGDTVQMDKDAFFMIHDAWGFEMGNAEEMQKTAALLEQISDQIANIYTGQIEKAGKLIDGDKEKTKRDIRKKMKSETWLNAQQALELGLIDKIVERESSEEPQLFASHQSDKLNAKFRASLKNYKHVPNKILSKYQPMKTEDKKTLWQAIKGFFVSEIKAEAEAQNAEPVQEVEETTPDPVATIQEPEKTETEMTTEEMLAKLKADGYQIEAPVVEAKDDNAAILARLEKLEAENKALKLAQASKPAGSSNAEPKRDNSDPMNIGAEKVAQYDALANYIKANARRY